MKKIRLFNAAKLFLSLLAMLTVCAISNLNAEEKVPQKTDIQKDYPVEIISEDLIIMFNKNGTHTRQFKRRYRILNAYGAEKWNYVIISYKNWYQYKPGISAKVVSPDGKSHILDPKTISEQANHQDDDLIYNDTKTLKAPLPAIEIGSIVDEEYSYKTRIPLCKAGNNFYRQINGELPVGKATIVISYPAGTRFVYKLNNISIKPVIRKSAEMVTYTFNFGKIDGIPEEPGLKDRSINYYASLEFTTAPSWNSVAKEYFEISRKQRSGSGSLDAILKGIKSNTSDKKKLAIDILTVLNKEVRYTGLEFMDSALVPWTPDEVLKRKFGDCKDKSLLFIESLSRFGIKANLVLLKNGNEEDVSPDMPGLGHFNHVIVYIPELKMWVDTTVKFCMPGTIPLSVQDRYALVIDPSTVKLIKTPARRASENCYDIEREYFIPNLGNSRIREKLNCSGYFDLDLRYYFDSWGRKKIEERIINYAEEEFNSKKTTHIKYADSWDYKKNFYFQYEVDDSDSSYTSLESSYAELYRDIIAIKLPEELRSLKNFDGINEPEGSQWKDRKADVHLPNPHICRVSYKINIPKGFEITRVPENSSKRFGDLEITEKFETGKGFLLAEFVLNTGKGVLKPEEVLKLRQELYNISKTRTLSVNLNSHSSLMIEKGAIKEGVQYYRNLIAENPVEPSYYAHLGKMMLAAGLRDLSIEYIKKAISINGSYPELPMQLGWLYLHDPFGRYFKGKIDIARAMQTYEGIIKADGNVRNAFKNMAILNEYDSNYVHYGPSARYDQAIKYYEMYKTKFKDNDLDYNFLLALYFSRQYDRILGLNKSYFENNDSWAIFLTALAIKKDTASMFQKLNSITSDIKNKGKILNIVAGDLSKLGHFPKSLEVLQYLSRFPEDTINIQTQIQTLQKIKKWESFDLNANTPEAVVLRIFKGFFIDEINEASLKGLYSWRYFDFLGSKKIVSDHADLKNKLLNRCSTERYSPSAVMDIICSTFKAEKTGDDNSGYTLNVNFELFNGEVKESYYIIRENGRYLIIGNENFNISPAGILALSYADKNEYKNASRLLDWACDRLQSQKESPAPQFISVWKHNSQDPTLIRSAAHILISENEKYINPLYELSRSEKDKNIKTSIDKTLIYHHLKRKEYKEALPLAKSVMENEVKEDNESLYLHLLYALDKKDEIRKCLAGRNDSINSVIFGAMYFADQNRLTESQKLIEDAHARKLANDETYNLLAWIGIYTGKPLKDMLSLSLESNKMSNYNSHAQMNTLATIYAEMGMISESTQVIMKILDMQKKTEPDESDYYILGRNAETLGLPDIAKQYYGKIKEDQPGKALSVYKLAEKRMKILSGAASVSKAL